MFATPVGKFKCREIGQSLFSQTDLEEMGMNTKLGKDTTDLTRK